MAAGSAHASLSPLADDGALLQRRGSVQYLELAPRFSGEQFLADHTLISGAHLFTFPQGLPGDSGRKTFLVGTEGFAALRLVTPDYIVPNGFFNAAGGSVDFAGVDIWNHPPLPTDGRRSLDRATGSPGVPSPFNFAGVTATIDLTAAPAASYQGLWWRSPGGSENGWGVNVAHQGDVLFADLVHVRHGRLGHVAVLRRAQGDRDEPTPGSSTRRRDRPFPLMTGRDSARRSSATSHSLSTDSDTGTFSYTAKGVTQSKAITKFIVHGAGADVRPRHGRFQHQLHRPLVAVTWRLRERLGREPRPPGRYRSSPPGTRTGPMAPTSGW
jgi:hypothetical protein